ncbi:hypothetical protein DPMN_143754 [Dreissena polymorpha]|uniref:C3H1-type domain-containing protein n=1 Tax=Dreissena polymorpha TaxID=45954 RepID=A0A9D4GE56_DREPO|nr:hypothetical protein DPMN_143754 [Dreissena polymorpha]
MQSSKFNRRHVRRNVTQINTTTTQKFVKVGPKVPERYSSVHSHNLSESSNLSLSSSEAKKEGEKTKSAADELNYYMSKEHLRKADTVPRNYRHRKETDSPESYSSIDRLNYHNEREMRYRERSPFEERRHSVNDRNYRDVHRSESGTSGEIYERGHGHYHESPSRSYGHERSGEYIFTQKQKISHEESNYRKNHKEHRVGNTTYESRRSRSPKFSKGSIHESIKVESESRHSDRGGGALLFEDGEHVPTADERHTSQSSHDTHSRHSGALLIEDGSNVTYGDVRRRSHEIELGELEHVSEDSDIVDGLEINRRNDVYGHRSDTYQFDRDQDYERRSLSSRHETKSSSRAKEHLDSEYEHSNMSDLRSERSKRRLSPVSAGTLSSRGSKYKRGLSPVSHEDLTIHISDRGRWIEGKHSQESIDEHHKANSERDERHFQDGKVMIKNDHHGDLDREMVSDDESYIDDHVDNFRSYLEVGRDNIRSNKEVFDDRYRSGTPHSYEKVPESSVKEIALKSVEKGLNIPDLCKHYNKNKNVDQGCLNAQCKNLHICKAMVLESCKFGPKCKKSHEFTGQSRKLLMNLNPGIDLDSRHTYWKICMILQKKILIECGREDLLEVIDEKFADRLRSLEEAKADEREIVQVPQPSTSSGFFSKARSGLKDKTSRHQEKERRRSNEEISRKNIDNNKENQRRTPDVQTVSRHSKESSDKVIKMEKDKKHAQQGLSEDIKGSLSPVSGDERNWEEHETYDKVSDDGISDVSEKQPDLESTSHL